MTYAADTSVSVQRSREELEKTLNRYGATAFGYATRPGRVSIVFEAVDRRVAFELDLPRPDEKQFTHSARGARTANAAHEAWEQACRQKWRALNLVVKAKLEAVDAGIAEFEDEFAAYIVLPGGGTVGQWLRPQIEQAYATGAMPALMP